MNLTSDRQRFLQDELNTYEKTTQMNETERNALHEWVAAGNSVHENTCNAEDGHGNYIDFLDVYREEQDIRDTLSALSDEEKEEYLAELRGEDTIKSLKKRLDELLYKTDVYEKVLQRHNLIEEAKTLMEEGYALSRAFDEWAKAEMGKLPEGELSWLK